MIHLKSFPWLTRTAAGSLGLFVVLFSCYPAPAQTVAPEPPQRWLLIFDTSITMRNWLPATTTELENVFVSSMSGELHLGDSVGVWTFAQKLRATQYPLLTWDPAQAASESSGLNDFLNHQHFLGRTSFAVLRNGLKNVIAHSQRLTIIIFCDGDDNFKLTPYDDGINRIFKQMKSAREKAKVPFVVVVRTQEGRFVGATVNLPPGNLDFPPFPPLPVPPVTAPAAPPAAPVATPPPAPVPAPAPLVIVGTNVITNPAEIKKISGP